MMGTYVLKNREPVECPDLREWAMNVEGSRRIASTTVFGTYISTVFLGIDHSFGDGPPVLFETMVFDWPGHEEDEYQTRCSTWGEALSMHDYAIMEVQRSMPWWKRLFTFTDVYGEKI